MSNYELKNDFIYPEIVFLDSTHKSTSEEGFLPDNSLEHPATGQLSGDFFTNLQTQDNSKQFQVSDYVIPTNHKPKSADNTSLQNEEQGADLQIPYDQTTTESFINLQSPKQPLPNSTLVAETPISPEPVGVSTNIQSTTNYNRDEVISDATEALASCLANRRFAFEHIETHSALPGHLHGLVKKRIQEDTSKLMELSSGISVMVISWISTTSKI